MSIVLTALTKRYGDNVVVNRVSLEIEDGELFVLLGGSGSGKSTILRLIAGLVRPDGGRIELHGQDVTYLPPQARSTGFVFQNYSIFRHMTARENVEFGLRIRQVPPAERRRRSEELLDLVGLVGLGDRYADQLSGGQQQRVALARALAYEPAVLLLDEPFGALDVKIRAQLRHSLKEIQSQLQVTTILVTHDQEEAFELGDRIGLLERGDLIEVGDPEGLYHRPRTEFAATFIGGGNVLVGRIGQGQIRLGTTTLPMPADAPAHDEGAHVRVLFRPETVLLQTEPFAPESGVSTLGQGRVVEVTFAGPLSRVSLEVEDLRGVRPITPPLAYGRPGTLLESALPSRAYRGHVLTPGQVVWIGLPHYHVLSPSGLKLLIYLDDSQESREAAQFGCQLALAAGGPLTLLAVVDTPDDTVAARERLDTVRQQWMDRLPRLEMRVRQGRASRELVLEAQEGHYEVVVLSQPRQQPRFYTTTLRLLTAAGIPVLLAQSARPALRRMLICTAAGEPGKTDVQVGGRLARLAGAQVTVLHVRAPENAGWDGRRAARHLRQAQASLHALGVESVVKVEDGPVVERILRESADGDYDLVVIGAPAPRASQRFFWTEWAGAIVTGANRPVLVVPMMEY